MQQTSSSDGISSDGVAGNPQPRTVVVLLVEDDVLIRLSLAEDLRAAGYLVIEAGTADEALGVLRAGTAVDFVITDVRMPGSIDGLALAHAIRQGHPGIRIVLVTGQASHVAGPVFDGVFGKPCDPPKLIRHLRRLTGEAQSLS